MPNPSAQTLLSLYEAALKPATPTWRRALLALWTVAGLSTLTWFCWAEPFSARFFAAAKAGGVPAFWTDWIGVTLVMAARAILVVETVGYIYHRFFQHVGRFTRLAPTFRNNQMYHWAHHMIIYPIGRFYRRAIPYVPSETGIAWSWVVPALLAFGAALATMGPRWGTFVFMASIGLYASRVIDVAHLRFHEVEHPWASKKYFNWLEEIHLLHHWDQRYNFTIVNPLMDMLFGSYLAPETHRRETKAALEDKEITVSDLINWRYLLLEANPVEYAAFISQAQRHAPSLRKMDLLLKALRCRADHFPREEEAAELYRRARDLAAAVRAPLPSV